jgi:hypothetical protein
VFTLADGTQITRRIGDAIFVIDGGQAASPVIFGEKGDTALFGTVSLETLGFVLDPMERELRPLAVVPGWIPAQCGNGQAPFGGDEDHPTKGCRRFGTAWRGGGHMDPCGWRGSR